MKDQLRMSTPQEESLQASKWLKLQMLIDPKEMESLFSVLQPFSIFLVGTVIKRGEETVSHHHFLECYTKYISQLKNGHIPDDALYRTYFSSVLTKTADFLYAIPIGADKQIVRVSQPIVQLQTHQLNYSQADGKFHPLVFGIDSILWGIQFSYPQLYRDNQTKEIYKVDDREKFPNTFLFRRLQHWVRENTIPTPFLVGEKKIIVPMRLGKQCRSWINQHLQLIKKGLKVDCE